MMKLNTSEQKQFINMLNGGRMNKNNSSAFVVWCIVLLVIASIIKVYALIYCVQWGFGATVTVQQAFIIGAISGLYTRQHTKSDEQIDRYLIRDMVSSGFITLFAYVRMAKSVLVAELQELDKKEAKVRAKIYELEQLDDKD